MFQWSRQTNSKNENDYRYFPISYPSINLIVLSVFNIPLMYETTWTANNTSERVLLGSGDDYGSGNNEWCYIFSLGY